jgi:hypothetical protein
MRFSLCSETAAEIVRPNLCASGQNNVCETATVHCSEVRPIQPLWVDWMPALAGMMVRPELA